MVYEDIKLKEGEELIFYEGGKELSILDAVNQEYAHPYMFIDRQVGESLLIPEGLRRDGRGKKEMVVTITAPITEVVKDGNTTFYTIEGGEKYSVKRVTGE